MPVAPAQLARLRKRAHKGGAAWLAFNPPPGLWIGGVNYTPYLVQFSPVLKSTFSPYAGNFKCQLDAPAAALAAIRVEQELTWNRDGVQYAGRVRSAIPDDQILASANVTLTVECQDFTTLLDADICAIALSAPQINPNRAVVESDLQRIGWLLQSFGRQGVSLHHVQQNYASVPATDYTGMTLRDAVKSVLAYSGGSYYVDYGKDLHCFIDERQYAPFTLSEAPDNVASFPYAGLGIPTDSVDLRNAVYGIPGSRGVGVIAIGVDAITPSIGLSASGGALATFKAIANGRFQPAGPAGAFTSNVGASINPPYGQTPVAGDLLIAWACCSSSNAITGPADWTLAVSNFPSSPMCAIFYKIAAGGDATPTFASVGGADFFAQVVEFSGASGAPLDQTGTAINNSGGSIPQTVSAAAADVLTGNLVVLCARYTLTGFGTATFADSFNVGTAVHIGDSGAVSQQRQASFSYAIVPAPIATWYTDEASITLYGRRETSFTDTTIASQADLDAKAAAALAKTSQPRREGSFRCRRVGLAVGQRFTIQSSLYTVPVVVDSLGNYSGIVQAIETSYSEDEPGALFAVEFMQPTVNLAVQLGQIVASIPAPTAAALKLSDYRARAHAVGGQSIPVTTNTKVQLGVKDADPSGSFDATTNHRYTAKVAGTYAIEAGIQLAAQVGANYYIAVNGSLVNAPSMRFGNTAPSAVAAMSGGDAIYLAVGDYVELWTFVATATTIEATNSLLKNSTYLAVTLLSAS